MMLCTVVVIVSLVALLSPASSHPTRLQWFDSEDMPAQESADEPTWQQLPTKRDLGDEMMAAKRALSVLSRWKPFTDTFRSAYPSRAEVMSQLVPRGVEVETRGSLRPPGQPLRWGR